MPKQRIQWPHRGRVDNNAEGDQPQLSTSDAVNVRSYAAGTDRMQGGQRPGLSKLVPRQVSAQPVKAIKSLVFDKPAFTYTQQDPPSSGAADWKSVSSTDTSSVDVYVDESGNSYFLNSDGVIDKRNAKGLLIWSAAIPTQASVVNRITVDEEGNVYIAVNADGDGRGDVIRMVANEEDTGLDPSWSVPVDADEITDIFYRAGILFVAGNNNAVRDAYIYAFTALDGDAPNLTSTYEATWPIRQVAYSRGGLVYAAAPNADRANVAFDSGVEPGEVAWTPIELTNAGNRLHCWLDAQTESGIDATDARDRRAQFIADASAGVTITDDTERGYTLPPHSATEKASLNTAGMEIFPAYEFDPTVGNRKTYTQGFPTSNGGHPSDMGYDFAKGAGYRSTFPEGLSQPFLKDKDLISSKLPRATALWPQTKTHSWATTMLIRCNTDEPMVVWGMNVGEVYPTAPDPHRYAALVINATTTTGDYAVPPDNQNDLSDKMATSLPGAFNEPANPFKDDIDGKAKDKLLQTPGAATIIHPSQKYENDSFSDWGADSLIHHSNTATFPTATGADNSSGAQIEKVYIVTVVMTQPSGGSSDYVEVKVRCNGVQSTQNSNLYHESWGQPYMREFFGNRVYEDVEAKAGYHSSSFPFGAYTAPPYVGAQFCYGAKNFDGFLCEAVTYFGDSSGGNIHNEVLGSVSASTPASPVFNTFADDIEAVEGYMAHRWGVATAVLPTSHKYRTGPPSSSNNYDYSTDFDGSSVQQALASQLGITAKLNLVTGGHAWAYAGAGMGYSVVADDDKGYIFTGGPKDTGVSDTATSQVYEDYFATHRKIVDLGQSARIRRAGYGTIRFFSNLSSGQALSFTPAGGSATTLTAGTDFTIGSTLSDTVDNFVTAFNALSSWNYEAVKGPQTLGGQFLVRIYDITDNLSASVLLTAAVNLNSAATTMDILFQMFPSSTGVASSGGDDSAWTYIANNSAEPQPADILIRAAIDADYAFYTPRTGTAGSGSKTNHIRWWPLKPSTENSVGNADNVNGWTYIIDSSSTDFAGRAVGLKPELEHVWPDSSITGPEYMWVASDNVKGDGTLNVELEVQRKVALVARAATNQDVRTVQQLAVSNTKLYLLTGTNWIEKGTVTQTLSSGTSAFTQMVPAFGQMFIVDNGLYKVWDPIKGGGTLEDWEAETAGEIPEGCRLAAFYRGRMVVARSDREPFNIFASAVGDPYNWDFFPKVDVVTKAFGGANQDTARNPDVVNALAPFYDDVLLVGGDHSITQYRGDLSELGQIDYFTDVTGMAFGNSWALSPEGLLYFFGSRGGVWVMSPRADGRTQPPVELTAGTIAEELRSIDLSVNQVRLVWDQESQGLHLYVVPLTASVSASTQHWFYEARTKAWWPVKFAATSIQPHSATLLEGVTPSDRKVAIGCNDGYVRQFDDAATNDDGTNIASSVLIGPIFPSDVVSEQKMTALQAMLSDLGSGGCQYKVYVSDNPMNKGTAVTTGSLSPGFNSRLAARARGGYIWIELLNSTSSPDRWALESLHADIYLAGRRRDR